MPILRSSPASPFGRKVKVVMKLLGLADTITVVNADTMDPTDDLRSQNPLGKIPALVMEDGSVIYDSRVIVEYLDLKAGGGKVIPLDPKARIEQLTLQALADGIVDAGLLCRYEGVFRMPERQEAKLLDHQRGKAVRALNALEGRALTVSQPLPQIGEIAVACALGWVNFRLPDWLEGRDNLKAYLADMESRFEVFAQTRPG